MHGLLEEILSMAAGAACLALVVAFALVALAMTDNAFRRWWRSTGVHGRRIVLLGAVLLTGYAGSKHITRISASDDGIVLTDVELTFDDGTARLVAASTGAAPSPAWYRESTTNDWTLATDDGWNLVYTFETDMGLYTNVWERAETNGCVHASWYFGANPPPVEIAVEGGVEITGFAASGRSIRLTCLVDESIELPDGSEIAVEMRSADNIWIEQLREPARHGELTAEFVGFFLDRPTWWRVRLEVPQ